MRFTFSSLALAGVALAAFTGCAHAVIEPGHRGLRFDPKNGGLQHEVLQPGYHSLSCGVFERVCPRVEDFDVTYSTRKEDITTNSAEGLALTLKLAIVYRPIIAELYQLDTEIGTNYYDEVVGPEFKSAARGVFARHSYLDLQKKNEKIENEIEAELRRRIGGKHIEISSVLLEHLSYAPEIAAAVQSKLVAEQEAARQKAALENDAARTKRTMEIAAEQRRLSLAAESEQAKAKLAAESEQAKAKLAAETEQQKLRLEAEKEHAMLALTSEAEKKKLEIQLATDQEKFRLESALRTKKNERQLAQEQAQIDKLKADGEAAAHISTAHGEAEARLQLARASGEEKKAEGAALTPMHVMMHAYDALAHLGGNGTTILLGDWSKVPNFLFPRVGAFQSAFTLPWGPYGSPGAMPYQAPAPTSSNAPAAPSSDDAILTSTARR